MCNPITTLSPYLLLDKGIHRGYEWEVTHNDLAYRCGYVRIPAGHPWHGKGWSDVPAQAHGGLTFFAPDYHCGKGGPDDAWWIGFDCAHAWDAPDPELPGYVDLYALTGVDLYRFPQWTIKSTEYVKAECIRLIEQAVTARVDI